MAGCWTCRIRKKKCDHAKPSCSECSRLEISCDGYGDKPTWVDGGAREIKYRRELKNHIRRKAKHRRSDSLISQLTDLTPPLTEFGDADVDTVNVFDNQFDHIFSPTPILATGYDATTAGMVVLDTGAMLERPYPLSPMHTVFDDVLAMPDLVEHDEHDPQNNRGADSQSLGHLKEHCNIMHCKTLMYYLDHLFWDQYPLCGKSAIPLDRTWILTYVSQSPIFKSAVTQFSASRLAKACSKMNMPPRFAQDDQKFVQRLQENIASLTFQTAPHAQLDLKTMLATTSILTYQSLLLGVSCQSRASLLKTRDILDGLSQQHLRNPATLSVQSDALRLSLSQAIFVDTLHAATQRSAYILDDLQMSNFTSAVEFDTGDIYGCPIWLLRVLRNTIKLDVWKRELSMHGRLSVPELVMKSMKLLDLLESKSHPRRTSVTSITSFVDENGDRSLRGHSGSNPTSRCSIKDTATQLYRNATSIYLHVIVSGANPRLPTIQALVDDSVTLLQSLGGLDVLACSVWPLMVISSLASGEHRESCRSIIMRVMEQQKLKHTFTQLLDVVQECWRLSNESPLLQWDWMMAMDNLSIDSTAFILPV